MLALLPSDGEIPIQDLFERMKQDPLLTLYQGFIFAQVQHLKSENKALSIACANGMLVGIALGYCSQAPEFQNHLEEYLVELAKARGGNVVQFLGQKKI